ncbi:anti-sigma factor [Kineococcus rubinsiae]|uniref:anti-sigma factor n=1 Tax=Kineococcus rubinsiae TaxID=2609562 RepID=UPI00142FCE89|nr:anti-sigma factor [Kineococcus rubinsiae]NIZ90001.1 anti-sigma factor [Kineococcus rubinsiae]
MSLPDPTAGPHLTEEEAVLAALGEAPSPAVGQHLPTCAACRAELDTWRRLVTTVRDGEDVPPVPLPPGTWEAVRREAGLAPTAPRPDLSVVAPRRDAPRRRDGRARRWLPVAAALVVGAGLGAGAVALRPDPVPAAAPAVASAELAPVASTGRGSATVRDVDGHRELDVSVQGVTAAPAGVLEVWLLDSDGGLLAVGTMAGDQLNVPLPADVDLARFATVDVSREPLDGDPAHSSDSVLRGELTPEA